MSLRTILSNWPLSSLTELGPLSERYEFSSGS